MFFSKFRGDIPQILRVPTVVFQSKTAKIRIEIFRKHTFVSFESTQNKKAIPYSDSSSKTASDLIFIFEFYCCIPSRFESTRSGSSVRKILTQSADDPEW